MRVVAKKICAKGIRAIGPFLPNAKFRFWLRGSVIPSLMDRRAIPSGYRPLHTRECRSTVLADPYVYTHHTIYWYKRLYEKHTARFLRSVLSPGGTLVDIGMNLGHFTTLGAELVGERGAVIAFEPNPNLCELVGEHLVSQGLGHVCIRNCALGAEEGSVTLTVPLGDSGSSFVAEVTGRDAGVQVERIHVPMRVGASELAKIEAENLIVKLDVEGAELEVLHGLRQVLLERVHAMQIEISPAWVGKLKLSAMKDLLTSCGFEILGACDTGPPQPVDIELIEEQQDVWCFRPGKCPIK